MTREEAAYWLRVAGITLGEAERYWFGSLYDAGRDMHDAMLSKGPTYVARLAQQYRLACDPNSGPKLRAFALFARAIAREVIATESRSVVIDRVRVLLGQWDKGLISRGEFEGILHDMSFDPFFAAMESGKDLMRFGSCCCGHVGPDGVVREVHPPERSFKVEFTIQPHGYTARRCD